MKLKGKAVAFTLTAMLSLGTLAAFAGCGEKQDDVTTPEGFDYATEKLSAMDDPVQDYNGNLFYVNTLDFEVADPSVIYVTEGKDRGYFYAYGTSDQIGGHGFQAWRSKDLAHWECTGVALMPDYNDTWAVNCYWAPEVIYDSEARLYYMFYNAFNINDSNRLCLSVAYSKTPDGPFLSPTGRDGNGKQLYKNKPVFDVSSNNPAVVAAGEKSSIERFVKHNALDASPFIDPVSKKKYLFFSYYDDYGDGSYIYGMEMTDWYTPDYSTLTRLTHPGYSTVARGNDPAMSRDRSEGNVNEGPFMVYHEGKYYLTFSVFGYQDANYHVVQAIADSPLGTFTKVDENKGGKVVSTDVINWSHIVSAGHHSFVQAGDETFIAYHTFKNRNSINGGRALAVDRVVWVEGEDGTPLLHTNGPSYSLQALPAAVSGYKNIAPSATVTANNTAEGSDVKLLTDETVKYQEFDLAEEYIAKRGTSQITLTWDSFKTVRGFMVYNSYDYEDTFSRITKVEMEYLKADGSTAKLALDKIDFDWDWFFESDYEFVQPGGSAIAEFDELPVKSITFTIASAGQSEELGINEIVVLGKDNACPGVSEFKKYSYENKQYGSPFIIRDSETFGTIKVDGKDSALKTMYGYDLTHDDGTENAYIKQIGATDQFAYFKDVYATDFYVEAEFTIPSDRAYAADLGSLHPNGDPAPKFGIIVSCNDTATNTIFYYVAADTNYTAEMVGIAQRTAANTDWDWTATEKTYGASGIKYKNGNKVKLAIIRQGKQFYLICNDNLIASWDKFHTFDDDQRAGVGFLSFNTPMIISGYNASADQSVIEAKLQQYVNK